MRKLKKITLKKEVIDRITDNQMALLMGGSGTNMVHGCGSSNGGSGSGSGSGSSGGSEPDTSDVDCPNTCGTAWTCNG